MHDCMKHEAWGANNTSADTWRVYSIQDGWHIICKSVRFHNITWKSEARTRTSKNRMCWSWRPRPIDASTRGQFQTPGWLAGKTWHIRTRPHKSELNPAMPRLRAYLQLMLKSIDTTSDALWQIRTRSCYICPLPNVCLSSRARASSIVCGVWNMWGLPAAHSMLRPLWQGLIAPNSKVPSAAKNLQRVGPYWWDTREPK